MFSSLYHHEFVRSSKHDTVQAHCQGVCAPDGSRKVKTQYLLVFFLSFVSNSLAYITIPKNKEKQTLKQKINCNITSANLVSLKKLKKVGKAPL